ncbi:MAG: cupin domain-containing protein [Planctomycetota bacterium]
MELFSQPLARAMYAADRMHKVNLVDTPSLFCDVYGLEPGQEQAGHVHAVGDKLYYVLAGAGRIRVGTDEREVRAGDLVCAPAGQPHAVRNTGRERLALLVTMAPKPNR